MAYCNPMNPNVRDAAPLIHEVHGEAYKITKAVYMALPFLWERLATIYGPVTSSVSVRGQVAIATEPNQIQIIPFPANISAKQVADSTCWVATLDGRRKYKYANSYLTSQGLVLRLDHQAPDNQKGMPFTWVIELTNKPWGHGPHGHDFMHMPFKSGPAPFNFPGMPRPIPGVPDKFPPFAPDCLHHVPPHPDACPPWEMTPPPPAPDGTIQYPLPPMPISVPDVDYDCGVTGGPVPPMPAVPPAWSNLL